MESATISICEAPFHEGHRAVEGPVAPPPPWELIPFRVACPRCGGKLNGVTNCTCPHCYLPLDWQDLVPLDALACVRCGYSLLGLRSGRCPECGHQVSWDAVFAAHRERKQGLFESCWRRAFIRSFVRTWWVALRPPALWSHVTLHDAPDFKGILLWIILLLGGVAILMPLCAGTATWLRFGDTVADWRHYVVYEARSQAFLGSVTAYALGVLGALMLFGKSIRRHRVPSLHIVRIAAYATLPTLPLLPVVSLALIRIAIALRTPWLADDFVLISLALVHITWSLDQAGRRYLHLAHGTSVAIAVQLIALLGAGLFCYRFFGDEHINTYLRWVMSPLLG